MPHFDFIWTDEIVEHLAEHGVTIDEFEQAMQRGFDRGPEPSRSEPDHTIGFAYTDAGRFLMVVFIAIDGSTVLPVTAYDPEPED